MARILSVLLLSACVFAVSPANAQVLCRFDDECGLGEACVSGTCAPLPQSSAACATGRCRPSAQAAGGPAANAPAEVPPQPTEEDQRNWKRNTTLLALGAVSVGVGTIGLVVGGITKVLSKDDSTVICNEGRCRAVNHDERVRLDTVGWIGLIGGGVLVVGGIPLIILGAKKHPVDKPVASATLEAFIGPTNGRLVLSF